MDDSGFARIIERSLHKLPEIPGLVRYLAYPDLQARISPLPFPFANRVGLAQLANERADAVIEDVRAAYNAEGKSFDWVVGPASSPGDLGSRLLRAGLCKSNETAGMALFDIRANFPTAPDIEVREANEADLPVAGKVLAAGFRWPEELANWFVEAHWRSRVRLSLRLYLAQDSSSREPIAMGTLVLSPQWPIAILGGAATAPAHQGRGAYKSLIARRLEDARKSGAEAAVISAVRATSAPIVGKLGFREVCALEFFRWDHRT